MHSTESSTMSSDRQQYSYGVLPSQLDQNSQFMFEESQMEVNHSNTSAQPCKRNPFDAIKEPTETSQIQEKEKLPVSNTSPQLPITTDPTPSGSTSSQNLSVITTPLNKHGKRKNVFSENLAKRNCNEVARKIEKLDPKKTLCIHGYVDEYENDAVVREYVDKLFAYPYILPQIPTEEHLLNTLNLKPNMHIDDHFYEFIIPAFMKYFSINYFQKNIMKATAASVSVLNPKIDLHIPDFALLPNKILCKITEAKAAVSIHIQNHCVDGTDFTKELRLVRIIYDIMTYISDSDAISTRDEKLATFMHIFAIGYFKSKMEFQKEYPIKLIDFSQRDSKVRHIMPGWRNFDPQNPPQSFYCKYAYRILQRIYNEQEVFEGTRVRTEYGQFLTDGREYIKKINSKLQNLPSRRQPDPNLNTSLTFHNSKMEHTYNEFNWNRKPQQQQHNNGYHKPQRRNINATRTMVKGQIKKSFSHQQQRENHNSNATLRRFAPTEAPNDFEQILEVFS